MLKIRLINFGVLVIVGILLLILSTGCTSTQSSEMNKNPIPPDPETGIASWINAVNHKDAQQLYLLEPDDIKEEISYEQFAKANENNILLTNPDLKFTGYGVLNRTVNQSTAKISAVLDLQKPVSDNSTQTESIEVLYTFDLIYEDNQWKIWTV